MYQINFGAVTRIGVILYYTWNDLDISIEIFFVIHFALLYLTSTYLRFDIHFSSQWVELYDEIN